ncbi:unnamed protein product, partial [Trichogramma brassicae]
AQCPLFLCHSLCASASVTRRLQPSQQLQKAKGSSKPSADSNAQSPLWQMWEVKSYDGTLFKSSRLKHQPVSRPKSIPIIRIETNKKKDQYSGPFKILEILNNHMLDYKSKRKAKIERSRRSEFEQTAYVSIDELQATRVTEAETKTQVSRKQSSHSFLNTHRTHRRSCN